MLLLACADESPTSWGGELPAIEVSTLTPDEVEAALDTWIPGLLQIEIPQAIQVNRDVVDRFAEDASCPAYVESYVGDGYTTMYWGYYQ